MSTAVQPPVLVAQLAEPAAQLTTEQIVQRIYEFAAAQMRAGLGARQIEQNLIGQGLDPETTRIVVKKLFQVRSRVTRQAGVNNMIAGALWCIGGIVVTAVTYQIASSGGGGGTFFVAWGAVIFGAIQFFRGLGQAAIG
jgi:hypothetical protein